MKIRKVELPPIRFYRWSCPVPGCNTILTDKDRDGLINMYADHLSDHDKPDLIDAIFVLGGSDIEVERY